jgi:hypothetical protein
MKSKFFLMIAITIFVASSHAATMQLHCKHNKLGTHAQFSGIATLEVADDNSVEGVLEWASRQDRITKMKIRQPLMLIGKMTIIPAGTITNKELTNFRLQTADGKIHVMLNSGITGQPRSSHILMNRNEGYASECQLQN